VQDLREILAEFPLGRESDRVVRADGRVQLARDSVRVL
jgi:hypothetical protein